MFMFFLHTQGLAFKLAAFAVFGLACLTDYWDGYIARSRNQITTFGQLLDPIADKILIFAAFLSFVEMGLTPAWMVILMLIREVLLTGFRLLAATRGIVIPADKGGKHKTVLQIVMIFVLLIFLIHLDYILNFLTYTKQNIKLGQRDLYLK